MPKLLVGTRCDLQLITTIYNTAYHSHSSTSFQTWVGNILLFINSYEPAGPKTHVVLRRLAELLLADLSNSSQPRVLVFGGLSGSGKSFTADQLLMKMFQMSHKTDWIQDLRRVRMCVCMLRRVWYIVYALLKLQHV